MKTNERIKKVREYFCDDSNVVFAKRVGVNTNQSSNWVSEAYNAGGTVLNKIIAAFPEINPHWLLTGEGEMTKNCQKIGNVDNSSIVGANVSGNGISINGTPLELIDVIKKQQEQIGKLIEIIDKFERK